MDTNQFTRAPFVLRPTLTQWPNQIAPMNNQQQYQKKIKQSRPNEQEKSSSKNSNVKGTDNNRKKRNLKPCLIIAGILFTLVALGAVGMSIYLFLFISKTMTTTTTITTTTTTTTSTTTSTTSVTATSNLPSQCYSYITIDDTSRLTSTGSGTACDQYVFTSSITWVRFNGAGGTQIPTYSPCYSCCGTSYSGWYAGTMPMFGATVSGPVYFTCYPYSNCYSTTIWVTNCNSFYVYGLFAPPTCNLRYCTV